MSATDTATPALSATAAALEGVATLPHLGVLRATGEEAAKFLHGQLTQDYALLGADAARLSALCSAKGRMLASFIGFKQPGGDILLVMSRDLLPQTLKRLSMFVLRAKVKLSDASAEFELRGLAGAAASAIAGAHPWEKRDLSDGGAVVTLYPADGAPRALWLAPSGTTPPAGAAIEPADWLAADARSGIATLTPPIVEAFVPQMLNYESVGGVNFKKGCYPGQEVVARSQFRGTLKRRAYVVHADREIAAGQDVFDAAEAEQPVGTVAQAARSAQGWDAIVSMQISAANADLRAGAADGVALTVRPLPYALLEDI